MGKNKSTKPGTHKQPVTLIKGLQLLGETCKQDVQFELQLVLERRYELVHCDRLSGTKVFHLDDLQYAIGTFRRECGLKRNDPLDVGLRRLPPLVVSAPTQPPPAEKRKKRTQAKRTPTDSIKQLVVDYLKTLHEGELQDPENKAVHLLAAAIGRQRQSVSTALAQLRRAGKLETPGSTRGMGTPLIRLIPEDETAA